MTSRREPASEVIPAQAGIQSPSAQAGIQFVLGLEVLDLPAAHGDRPEIVLLHEGLGSVSMWRDFPQQLALRTGSRVIAYSRRGFGRSEPRTEPYDVRFMHDEALDTLPRLREALGIREPVLFGHSTGASMSLIHAGANRWPVAGIVAMAPITFIEPSNIASIEQAREIWRTTDWRSKLAKHHDDVDMAWSAWNDTWLDPAFLAWTIEDDLPGITAPILCILGSGDQYSTPAQVDYVKRRAVNAARFQSWLLEDCGHAPHRDRPEAVLQAVERFVSTV